MLSFNFDKLKGKLKKKKNNNCSLKDVIVKCFLTPKIQCEILKGGGGLLTELHVDWNI